MHRRYMADLMHDCPGLTTALVHHMLDRARDFRSAQMADERLQSLGRLASGLAHELNNPASAAARHARSLPTWLEDAERAARVLAGAQLTDDQLDIIDAVRMSCTGPAPALTAIAAADREDDIADWLTGHGLDRVLAEVLAASNVTVPALDRLAEVIPGASLGVATRWVAAACAARAVAHQVETSTTRIHELVAAIKGFSFMDREGVPEDVDVARGLADTVAILESKSRAKAIGVQLETAPDLPRVHGFGSELNQLWEKLIDNALDAAGPDGRVAVTATGRGDSVLVRVSDDGPGIPDEIRAKVFDPFFTTKPVGRGSGLGLYLARRVVLFHQGDLEFTSQPGRTVFRVRLPAVAAPGLRGLESLGRTH
jgi:signal transduction histidine kinase